VTPGATYRQRAETPGTTLAGGPVTATSEVSAEPATPTRMPAGRLGERGGASLVALALTAFLLLAGLLAVDVGALAAARAGAQNAADLAALAALTPGGGSPSARAAAVAEANGAELAVCDCSAVQAVVTVRRRVVLAPTGLSVRVTARARAVLAPTGTGRGFPLGSPGQQNAQP
jgi:secretion/DNA translocation related TadE-like protein